MELAAAKIQALYRGHSVRQNLRSWQLSSGRTLYQTLEESRRRAFLSDIRHEEPVKLVSANQPPIKIIDKSPDMKSDSGSRSHRGVPQTSNSGHDAPSSVTTLISEALGHSKSLLEDANQSLSRVSSKKSHVSFRYCSYIKIVNLLKGRRHEYHLRRRITKHSIVVDLNI